MNPARYKSIIIILFAVSLLLLISYLVLEEVYPDPSVEKQVIDIEKADSIFISVLEDYGIKKSWFRKQESIYSVSLPTDVPAELIQLELQDKLRGNDLLFRSKEIKKDRSVLELSSGGELLLSANLKYDAKCVRETKLISFVLLNFDALSNDESLKLLNSSEHYTVALVPSKSNRWLADSLTLMGRRYALLLNDDIKELEYTIDDKFSDRKLITTFATITDNFSHAAFFILDDISSQYSDRVNNILLDQLNKRKINYFRLNEFASAERNYQIQDLFNNEDANRIVCIEASEFISLQDVFQMMRKRGIKIVNAGAVI